MKPESKLWQLVRKNLPDIHWTRIESWVNQGVPDCYGILEGTSVFVELKVTKSNKINLSPFQKNWLYNHYLQGGRSFILLQHLGQRALYLFSSSILHSPLSIAEKRRRSAIIVVRNWCSDTCQEGCVVQELPCAKVLAFCLLTIE